MTKEIQEKAAADTALIEAVAAPLPLPEPAEVLPDAGDPAKAAEIQRRMGEIDITSTGSIIGFGSAAQAQLQEISQAMLADVRNKDVGPAGSSLREIVSTIRGFSMDELDPRRPWRSQSGSGSAWSRTSSRTRPACHPARSCHRSPGSPGCRSGSAPACRPGSGS